MQTCGSRCWHGGSLERAAWLQTSWNNQRLRNWLRLKPWKRATNWVQGLLWLTGIPAFGLDQPEPSSKLNLQLRLLRRQRCPETCPDVPALREARTDIRAAVAGVP